MVRCEAVRAPRHEAESVRLRLSELGVLRRDVGVARDGDDVLFPVAGCPVGLRTETHDFAAREVRPAAYQDLLPPDLRAAAPRAFEQLGDLCIVKVPKGFPDEAWGALGDALLRFTRCRAVFHDGGVTGDFRVRDLQRIAGAGGTETEVAENGVRLRIDPAAAYYSPRLATERARVAAMVQSGEHVVDLFGGVAPLGVQAALRGAMVDTVDLNPEACALARVNVAAHGLGDQVRIWQGDARAVAADLRPADRVVMNLPHGAGAFLDVAAGLLPRGGVVHYHEILPRVDVHDRVDALETAFPDLRAHVAATRVVRTYSAADDHIAFDIEVQM